MKHPSAKMPVYYMIFLVEKPEPNVSASFYLLKYPLHCNRPVTGHAECEKLISLEPQMRQEDNRKVRLKLLQHYDCSVVLFIPIKISEVIHEFN